MVAVAGVRQSAPAKIIVVVTSVNDEAPEVSANEGLLIWEGATVPITPKILSE